MNDATFRLISVLRLIARSISLQSKRIERQHGISLPQYLLLAYLKQQQDCIATQKQLARMLNLNSSTLTGIIDRVEKKAWAVRLPKRTDRRTTYISLTNKGDRLLQELPDLINEELLERFHQLEPEQTRVMLEHLETLVQLLPSYDVPSEPKAPASPQRNTLPEKNA